jgi:hypothetical protein
MERDCDLQVSKLSAELSSQRNQCSALRDELEAAARDRDRLKDICAERFNELKALKVKLIEEYF